MPLDARFGYSLDCLHRDGRVGSDKFCERRSRKALRNAANAQPWLADYPLVRSRRSCIAWYSETVRISKASRNLTHSPRPRRLLDGAGQRDTKVPPARCARFQVVRDRSSLSCWWAASPSHRAFRLTRSPTVQTIPARHEPLALHFAGPRLSRRKSHAHCVDPGRMFRKKFSCRKRDLGLRRSAEERISERSGQSTSTAASQLFL